jgi:hypothetical protein
LRQPIEASEQQPGRKDDLDGETNLRVPSGRQPFRRLLESVRFVEQVSSAPVEQLAGRRERGLAPFDLERLDVEL